MINGMGTALVTGASSGIGRAFAERLAAEGYDLILTGRRRERLETLARHLRSQVRVEVIGADLCNLDDLSRVEERLAQHESMSLLVNNAGFGAFMPFAQLKGAEAERLILLQVLTPTRLVRAVLPGMLARRKGVIINMSSLLALSGTVPRNPIPFCATYAGAKSYLLTFSQSLAIELAGTGVKVQACLPGRVSTEFFSVQNFDTSNGPRLASAESVVEASLESLARDEVVCVPGLKDPGMVHQLGEAQQLLLRSALTPSLMCDRSMARQT